MKIKITKMPDGGLYPHKGDKYDSKKGKAGWNASQMTSEEMQALADELGYKGKDVKEFQKYILNHPDPKVRAKVDELHKQYGMPNAGEEADGYWGVRWDVYKNLFKKKDTPDPTFAEPEPEKIQNKGIPSGNEYELNNFNSNPKEPYNKRRLPFYQVAPDIAAFVESQNTYNYYTPDYNHWEISPATLNIQPQLNEINAGANSIYKSTTGNPQVDSIRKQAAFTASLTAKQQAYANKQNYDADARFRADSFNISARTQEQNLDVQAIDRVHNNYRALAKDFASGERLRALNSITEKYAKNERNENMKKLWLDNFYPNYTSNGTDSMDFTGDPYQFDYNYYPVDKKPATNSSTTTPVNTRANHNPINTGSSGTPGNKGPYVPWVNPSNMTTPKPKTNIPFLQPDTPFGELNNRIIPRSPIFVDQGIEEDFDPIRNQTNKKYIR